MDIEKIVTILRKGGIVIIPTDTVYGIVCDALQEKTVKRVYQLKQREFSKPMIILVSDIEMLKNYTKNWNSLQERLIDTYFPGAMTILLEKKDEIPDIVTSGKKEVGVRIPNNIFLREIIKVLGHPIIATSANISSNQTITNINKLEDSIKEKVDYLYDGGTIEGCASTIIKVVDDKISIIRDGDLSEDIRKNFTNNVE